ncbi:hypothetical protein BKA64DRAFT_661605 [Cadophora sp. MPI-SDFR-AT-0126]|nr:hypothetical protein BKA64DRAFT_661605 [Leotiomycetes sp. MPI-SDFR-AT-0126]
MVAIKDIMLLATVLTATTALPVGKSDHPSLGFNNKHLTPRDPGNGFSGGLQFTGPMKKPHAQVKKSSETNERGISPSVKMESFLVPQLGMRF